MAIGADQGVRVIHGRGTARLRPRTTFCLMHTARQVFQIHLVHDAKARRHHAKGVKGLHAPFHKLIAFAVALKFELHVQVERIFVAVVVHHHGVVHDQIHRHQWLYALGVFAQAHGHAAHGGQIG